MSGALLTALIRSYQQAEHRVQFSLTHNLLLSTRCLRRYEQSGFNGRPIRIPQFVTRTKTRYGDKRRSLRRLLPIKLWLLWRITRWRALRPVSSPTRLISKNNYSSRVPYLASHFHSCVRFFPLWKCCVSIARPNQQSRSFSQCSLRLRPSCGGSSAFYSWQSNIPP